MAAGRRRGLGFSYWKIWVAGTVSNLGDGVHLAALPLLAASLTRDRMLYSGLAVATQLPWLIFSLYAGIVVDRSDRRRLMAGINALRFALVCALATAVALDAATIWLLYGVALLLGIGETTFDIAAQALTPAVVPAEDLERANGRLFSAEIFANQFAGPPLGGLLFVAAMSLPFYFDAASFLVAGALIYSLKGTFRPLGPEKLVRRSVHQDIAEGVRWLWRHRALRTLALTGSVMNAAWTAGFATFGLYALEEMDVSERGFGLLIASMGVGYIAGGFLASTIVTAIGRPAGLLAAISAEALMALLIVVAPGAWLVAAGLVLHGLFSAVWNVVAVSLRQAVVPDHLFGRVNSAYRFIQWGSMPLGALAGGAIAALAGLRAPWLIGCCVLVVVLVKSAPVFLRADFTPRAEGEAMA